MLKLDSVKVKLEEDSIKDINFECFNENIKSSYQPKIFSDDVEKQIDKKEYIVNKRYLPFGVKNISVIEIPKLKKTNIIIEMSAKILKSNYFELINENTICEAMNNLNKTKAIKLYETEILNGNILKLDTTNNLIVSNEIQKYLDNLFLYKINHKYEVKNYGKQGIVFIRDVKTSYLKDRLIFYDKQKEIIKDKELLKYIKLDKFKNCLRCEGNHRHFSQIKRGLKTQILQLDNVLQNNTKVNYNAFKRITNKNDVQESLFTEYQELGLQATINMIGIEGIIKRCNYDTKIYRKYIRSKLSKNTKPTKQYNNFKKVHKYLLSKENGNIKEANMLMQEIKELLSNS